MLVFDAIERKRIESLNIQKTREKSVYSVYSVVEKLERNMEKLTEQDGKSLDMVTKNLEALNAIFPEAFTEDGVDFEVLRQLLGDGSVWLFRKNYKCDG